MTYMKAHFCEACKKEVSWDTRMHSRGTCPHCGYTNNSTIIDTIDVSYRNSSRTKPITLFKIITISAPVPVREFKQEDVEKYQLCLPEDAVIV